MLVELDIKNFAIIKSLKVRFQEKMTVIIGETGAGKSIIIDAVSLLMGGRGQKEMIRSGENKAVITGLFELDDQKEKIAQLCDQYGLPHDDDQLVISRELAVKGRNVVRINGQLTTINVLRDLGHYLVDIHGQHDQQILMDQDRQIDLVDNYSARYTLLRAFHLLQDPLSQRIPIHYFEIAKYLAFVPIPVHPDANDAVD